MTCKELRLKSLKVAEYLEKIGIQKGDHVTLLASHRSDVLPLFVGVGAYGAVLNFLDKVATARKYIYLSILCYQLNIKQSNHI